MPSKRREMAFGSLLLVPTRNGIHKGPASQGRGVPVVKMGEVYHADIVKDAERDLLDLTPDELNRLEVLVDDLLFCRTSLVAEGVGHCALVGELSQRTTFASNLIRVRLDQDKADPRYWFYYFRSPMGQEQLLTLARGTSVTTITGPDIAALDVPVSDISAQRSIARILGALDDKIELNRKMNETLEQMARAIFKACFTYPYEGLPMLMAGKPPSSFPLPLGEGGRRSSEGHVGMVDSPLGKIPKGWSVVPLGELFAVGLGGAWGQDAPTKSASTAVRCLRGIDCHELAEGGTPQVPIRWLSAGQAMDRILADGTIIVEGSGSFCGRSLLWDSAFHRVVQEPVVYSNFCKRLDAKCTVSQALVAWQQMREAYRAGEMQAFRTGTAFPNFDAHGALANLLVIRPPASVADTFAEFYSLGRRTDLMAQSRTLAAIRDALLPKLISGEIRTASDEVRSTNWERLAGEIQTTNDARRSTKREVRESNTGRSR